MRLILVDSGVMSRYISRVDSFVTAIDNIGQKRIIVSAVTKIELINWVNGYKSQLGLTKYRANLSAINQLPVIQIDRKVSAIAVDLSRRYTIKVPDLLIASTALNNDIEIFTINDKDFKIKGVNLYIPENYANIKISL